MQGADPTGLWSRFPTRSARRGACSASERYADARSLRQLDQIDHGSHFHLVHQVGAVELDLVLDRAEFGGDLLVRPGGDDLLENLALALGQ
jgi:hypothetical protein